MGRWKTPGELEAELRYKDLFRNGYSIASIAWREGVGAIVDRYKNDGLDVEIRNAFSPNGELDREKRFVFVRERK